MAIDRKPRIFFARTKALFGERMEEYARNKRNQSQTTETDFVELEKFRQEKRDADNKGRLLFRIATVLFGLIFLYVFLRLTASDIARFFY